MTGGENNDHGDDDDANDDGDDDGGDDDGDDDDDNDDLCDRERGKPEWQHLDHRPSFRPIAPGSTALHRVSCTALVSIALQWDAL